MRIFICLSTSSVAPKALLLLRKLDHNSLCWGHFVINLRYDFYGSQFQVVL